MPSSLDSHGRRLGPVLTGDLAALQKIADRVKVTAIIHPAPCRYCGVPPEPDDGLLAPCDRCPEHLGGTRDQQEHYS